MKNFFKSILCVAVLFSAFSFFSNGIKRDNITQLVSENIDALSDAITDEEFFRLTGCYAVYFKSECLGKDGNNYLYASKNKKRE